MSGWNPTSDQRRQQISEMLRNKGIICKDFLYTGKCPRAPTCPYMHVANGETRPVPWSVCTFFNQGVCLRDRCTFFHGTQQQLDELRATGSDVYQPQLYMHISQPPAEFLNPDGTIAVDRIQMPNPATPLQAPVAQQQQQQPVQVYQPLQRVMVLPPQNSLVSAPQMPQMQYYIQQPQNHGASINGYAPRPQAPQQQHQGQPVTTYNMHMNGFNSNGANLPLTHMSQQQQGPPQHQQHAQTQPQYFQTQPGQQFFFQVNRQ